MYHFNSHYGMSSLVDDETEIIVEWHNGSFDETHKVSSDPTTIAVVLPKGENIAFFTARKIQEMTEYIKDNYQEYL